MVSLLRFKHGGARQTGVAVAAALQQMHASGAWPTWLGDPRKIGLRAVWDNPRLVVSHCNGWGSE